MKIKRICDIYLYVRIVCAFIVSGQTFIKKVVSIQTKQEIIKLNKDISISIDKYMDARTEKFGLTAAQGVMLLFVAENGGIHVSELKKFVDTSKSTVSATLKRLCGKGFVTLEPLEDDNRQKRIVPTEKALRVKNSLSREFADICEELFGEFSQEELNCVCRFQKTVAENARRCFKNYMETEEK